MRGMLAVVVVAVVGSVACKDNIMGQGVRDSDKMAWRAQPVIELERHPFFSTVPVEKKLLSDGSELWDYTNCGTDPVRTNCQTTESVYGNGSNTNCRSTGGGTSCCHHQFVVRASMVEEYRPVGGACYTGCERRPGARCE